MSAPLKFLGAAIIFWVAFRAATMTLVPATEEGTRMVEDTVGPLSTPAPPELASADGISTQASQFAANYYPTYGPGPGYTAYPPTMSGHVPIYYYPVVLPARAQLPPAVRYAAPDSPYYPPPLPAQPELFDIPPDTGPELSMNALPALPQAEEGPASLQVTPTARRKLDRLQLSSWAMLRGRPGSQSLATGGLLGGSQAGARLTYALDRRLALSLRSSTPIGGSQGGELAGGIRLTPFPSIPLALTAERRQAIGRSGGRSAFAMFVEGGIYDQRMLWRFKLDGYGQAGVVGARSRDMFAEGGFMLTRPLFDRFTLNRQLFGELSAGFGLWGGVQPHLYRVDVGPRLSLRVRNNVRVHLDWRQRLAGQAEPGSGPAVTLAGDF